MKLVDLLRSVDCRYDSIYDDREIKDLCFDSRKVKKGSLFVAQSGLSCDGHDFLDEAAGSGVTAIVCMRLPSLPWEGVAYVVTPDSSEALGIIASNFYGNPSSSLKLVGVTGTNGKTTVATLAYDLCRSMGYKAGLLSTVCNRVDEKRLETTHTTPDVLTINRLLREMADAGCRYCFMEVSSHAVVQKRICGLRFAGGVFTNITHDHLDYHKTFKNYIHAKKAFFDHLPPEAFALTNADDKNGALMLQNTLARKYTCSIRTLGDFKGDAIEKHWDSMLMRFDGEEVWMKFTGDFNVYNLTAVYAVASLLIFPKDAVLRAMSGLIPVAGRFQTSISPEGVVAVVDYAHTPDALENVLRTVDTLRSGGARIITVVGAGGDRDKTKRPEMAEIACRYSNIVIFTSDNPRFEDPESILDDMEKGAYKGKYMRETDRKKAIEDAVRMAVKVDVVLIAGKGHENYQEIKGVRTHFDDWEIIKGLFKE